MASVIFFKFKGQRAAGEKVAFDGMTISSTELKNLIAEKKGLDTSKDAYVLLDPTKGTPFPDNHTYVRNSHVVVRRVPLTQPAPRRQQQAAAAAEEDEGSNQALALAQALAALPAQAAADATDEQGQLEQLKARQAIEDLQADLAVESQAAAWRAQTDSHIRQQQQHQLQQQQQQAQQGRGRGYGRGFGARTPGSVPPVCRYCGAVGAHWPDECPQRHAPRTDLRQVRAPTGIPSSYVREDEAGGLLLNTGRTGAVKTNDAEASSIFAALPAAKRAALAAAKAAQVPALADKPHEPSADDALLQTLLLDNEPADEQQPQPQLEEQQQPQAQSPLQQDDQQQQADLELPDAGDAGMALDSLSEPVVEPEAGPPPPAGGASFGLFDDDEDLRPPTAAAGEGLNLGIGMELDLPPPASQQQATPSSPLPIKQGQQHTPVKSPMAPAVQEAGGCPPPQLSHRGMSHRGHKQEMHCKLLADAQACRVVRPRAAQRSG